MTKGWGDWQNADTSLWAETLYEMSRAELRDDGDYTPAAVTRDAWMLVDHWCFHMGWKSTVCGYVPAQELWTRWAALRAADRLIARSSLDGAPLHHQSTCRLA